MGLRNNRIIALLLALCLVVSLTVAVYAYLSTTGGSVTNTFKPDVETNPSIDETFTENVKTNVSVNVGELDYAVYVRAAIVVTWQKTETVDGVDQVHVYGQLPVVGTDYSIDINAGNDKPWFFEDGFFYHRAMVPADGDHLTKILIDSCSQLQAGPEGYYLSVEIVAQTIQAMGATDATDGTYPNGKPAVTDAWGIAVDSNGNLVEPTS